MQSVPKISPVLAINLPVIWRRKHLTPAEQQVIGLVAAGIPTKEVAVRLNKSTATVRNQLYEGMRKLDVHTRYELIAMLRPVRAQPAMLEASEAAHLEYAI